MIEWTVDGDISCSNSPPKRIYWDVNNTANHYVHLEKQLM